MPRILQQQFQSSGFKKWIWNSSGLQSGVNVTRIETVLRQREPLGKCSDREWVSTDIDYIEQCPGLPIPPDQVDSAKRKP